MLATTFLLGLLYVVFTAVLIALLKSAVLAVVIAGGLLFAQYWFSDRIALYAMHGRIVTPEQAPELHAVIDRLCALADMPKPAVAIADVDRRHPPARVDLSLQARQLVPLRTDRSGPPRQRPGTADQIRDRKRPAH
jgi:Zn-dependent protease with chaperone function